MKYIKNILLLLIGFVAFTTISCSEEDKNLNDVCNVKLKLQISRQNGGATRATDAGIDALNENAINSVDLFFYKKGVAITDAPVFYATEILLPAGTKTQTDVSVSMPVDKFTELFPTDADTECLVYAIVNRPSAVSGDNALPSDKSIASLKDATILYAPDFAVRVVNSVTHKYSPKVQDDFVMDGQATVTRAGDNLTGNIPVERVAAKISLVIDGIDDVVTDNFGVKWMSDKNSVLLSLRRASLRTKLGSTPDEYIYSANKETDIFRLDVINLTADGEKMTTEVPFYTYPTNWKNDDNSRTHFILAVNWTKEDNSKTITTFYEININPAGSFTKRNSHYKINQTIGVLGSESEETPVVLYPCNYVILNWGDTHEGDADTDSDANLNRFKYLVVDETTIEMENVASKQIYFFSSDPIELTTLKVQWEYTGGNTSQTLQLATEANITSTTTDPTTGDITYTIENTGATTPSITGVANRLKGDYSAIIKIHNADPTKSTDRSYIYFEHQLNNSMTEEADYSEYTFTFGVRHKGNDDYKDEIKITQYPMIAIKAEQNSDYNADNDSDNDNDHKGYVIINNAQNGSGTYQVSGIDGSASNANPNRYIISVTSLPKTSDNVNNEIYIIGDPRTSESENLSSTLNADDNGRELQYYYGTETSAATKDYISPKFMIASSYAVHGSLGKTNAKNRCAAYQEDGYPAGRWRMATRAEMRYIFQLSEWGVIPYLFNPGGNYWSAQNVVSYTTTNGFYDKTTTTSAFVRCVYDIWYWGDERLTNKEEFVYGDKQM